MIMTQPARKPCPGCLRLRQQLSALQAEISALRAEVRRLHEQLAAAHKDSSNSSKPPSSDLVKPTRPPADEDSCPRTAGGQPGHPKHERPPFPPEQITHFAEHTLAACPCCGGA